MQENAHRIHAMPSDIPSKTILVTGHARSDLPQSLPFAGLARSCSGRKVICPGVSRHGTITE